MIEAPWLVNGGHGASLMGTPTPSDSRSQFALAVPWAFLHLLIFERMSAWVRLSLCAQADRRGRTRSQATRTQGAPHAPAALPAWRRDGDKRERLRKQGGRRREAGVSCDLRPPHPHTCRSISRDISASCPHTAGSTHVNHTPHPRQDQQRPDQRSGGLHRTRGGRRGAWIGGRPQAAPCHPSPSAGSRRPSPSSPSALRAARCGAVTTGCGRTYAR
jgi:hypothetical protein